MTFGETHLARLARAARSMRAPADPRLFQIAALSSLLAFGVGARAFDVSGVDFFAALAGALLAQRVGTFAFAAPFEVRSALITALSVTLLLRADGLAPIFIAALAAVASKFLLRARGKHIFNPANFGVVAALLLAEPLGASAWTTPGQWGSGLILATALAGAGAIVTSRASRLDAPVIFLGAFAAMIYARAVWLGDPLTIPTLRLQSGALILFAFFMISDPKTTPDAPRSRAAFLVFVAALAYAGAYWLHEPDAAFYALAIASLIRPAFEAFDRAPSYAWPQAPRVPSAHIPSARGDIA
ncbi:MAG: RnfABCDGE type electron transport complex subunit D [Parvularculaceae bacterium]